MVTGPGGVVGPSVEPAPPTPFAAFEMVVLHRWVWFAPTVRVGALAPLSRWARVSTTQAPFEFVGTFTLAVMMLPVAGMKALSKGEAWSTPESETEPPTAREFADNVTLI